MLKHEKIIRRMSLKDKITFLFSSLKFRNSELEDFEFPLFNISDEVSFVNKDQTKLVLSNKAIASTWNKNTFNDVYMQVSKNLLTNGILQIFSIDGNVQNNNISEDFFLNLQLQKEGIKVLRKNKSLTCLSLIDYKPDLNKDFETSSSIFESIFKSTGVDAVLVSTVNDYKDVKNKVNFDGYFFGYTNSIQEAIKFLNAGSVVTFIDDIDEEDLQREIVQAMNEYAYSSKGLKDEMITKETFKMRIDEGEITSIDIIDKGCNQLIELFVELSRRNGDDCINNNVSSFTSFNKHVALEDCAEQSVILLKNDESILPLKHKTRVAILGDAINQSYSTFAKEKNPLDYIKKCEELVSIGYAQGYMLNHPTDAILVNDAYNLAISADVSIVYLSIDKNGRVPANQLTLLNTLKKNGIKIIGVLNNPETKDFSYVDYCDAAIFSYYERNSNAKAVLDVIIGEINPSGKLVETVLVGEKPNDGEIVPLYSRNLEYKFPFGYGLSYTSFEYSNLEVDEKGVRFTVMNIGNSAGYTTPQLYIQCKDSKHALRNKLLRGFDKVYLRKGEATKVFIPFTENTFRYYNAEKKLYGVEKGEYHISIGESYADTKLEKNIFLEDYLYGDEAYRSIRDVNFNNVDNQYEEFMGINDGSEIVIKDKFSKKTRLVITGAVAALFVLCDVFVLISYWISFGLKLDAFSSVMLILILLILLLATAFVVYFVKQKEVVVNDDVNGTLTEIVEEVNEFYTETKEVYATYVPPVEEEEIVKEISENPEYEETVEQETKEEIERKYVANYESKDTSITFNDYNSIEELCSQFMTYTRSKGVAIEIESARRLWSAVLSSKLVFLSSNDNELLKVVIQCLIEYLGSNTFIQEASNRWKKTKDTLWKKTRVEFLPTNFANSLNNACNSKECLNIVPLVNVRIENLFYYFNDFIENANNPLSEIKIELNENETIILPKNICYILVPADPSFYDNLPYYISNISFEVNLILDKIEPEEAMDIKHISYKNLLEIISSGKEKFFMSESKWKNFDEFEDAVSKTDNFVIGNKATLQIESFVSSYLECGGDVNDINDVIFITKIIPMMKSTSLYKNETGEKDLVSLIQNVFENDDMTSSIKACKRIEMVTPFEVPDESDESEENYEEAKEAPIDLVISNDDKLSIEISNVIDDGTNVENKETTKDVEVIENSIIENKEEEKVSELEEISEDSPKEEPESIQEEPKTKTKTKKEPKKTTRKSKKDVDIKDDDKNVVEEAKLEETSNIDKSSINENKTTNEEGDA